MGTGVRRRKNEIEFQEIEDWIALVLINRLMYLLIDFYFNNKTLCSYFLIEQSTSIKSII